MDGRMTGRDIENEVAPLEYPEAYDLVVEDKDGNISHIDSIFVDDENRRIVLHEEEA